MMAALLLLAAPLLVAAQQYQASSSSSIGLCSASALPVGPHTLSGGAVRASFGGAGRGGALTELQNLGTGTNYLSPAADAGGNPFRLVLGPTRVPPAAQVYSKYGDPSFSDVPWPAGALGGTFADAANFTIVSAVCGGTPGAPQLALALRLDATPVCSTVWVDVTVSVAAAGQLELALALRVARSCEALVAPAWLTGLGLGLGPAQDQRAIDMFECGQVGGPAWENAGGFYGLQLSMQWQSVWAEDPGATVDQRTFGPGNGLTVFAADATFQPKTIHRFPVNTSDAAVRGGLGFLFPVPVRLVGGAQSVVVAAPMVIAVHTADWRLGAAAYAQWFNATFQPRAAPDWVSKQVHIYATGLEGPKPGVAEKQNITFEGWLLSSLITTEVDVLEPAGWWQACSSKYQNMDGQFWPPREDMGGVSGLRNAIAISQQRLGRKVCLYVCAAEVANETIASSNGTIGLWNSTAEIREWAEFTPAGLERPGDGTTVRMCRGWNLWQQQVAKFVSRIVAELRPACIRLDCLKEPGENW